MRRMHCIFVQLQVIEAIFKKLPGQLESAMLANGKLRESDLESYLQQLQEVVYDWKGIMTLQPRIVDSSNTPKAEQAAQTCQTIEAVVW